MFDKSKEKLPLNRLLFKKKKKLPEIIIKNARTDKKNEYLL